MKNLKKAQSKKKSKVVPVTTKKKTIPAGGKPRASASKKQSFKAKEKAKDEVPKDEAAAEDEAVLPEKVPASAKKGKKAKKAAKEAAEATEPSAKKAKTAKKDDDEGSDESEAESEEPEDPKEPRAVIYLGGIPRGCEESELRRFLFQFGRVTRMRLARSKKTAAPKGYAFIEFKEKSVAEVVADLLDRYMLWGNTLKCHLIDKHPRMFKGANRKWTYKRGEHQEKFRTDYNDRPTVEVDGEEIPQLTRLQVRRQAGKRKSLGARLAQYGVDFDLTEVLGEAIKAGTNKDLASFLGKQPKAEAKEEAADGLPKADAKEETAGGKPEAAKAEANGEAAEDVAKAEAELGTAGDAAPQAKKKARKGKAKA